MAIKTRPKPKEGDAIRILPPFGDPYEAKVFVLLATMFTAYKPGARLPIFLYYDVMKGDTWEYV